MTHLEFCGLRLRGGHSTDGRNHISAAGSRAEANAIAVGIEDIWEKPWAAVGSGTGIKARFWIAVHARFIVTVVDQVLGDAVDVPSSPV